MVYDRDHRVLNSSVDEAVEEGYQLCRPCAAHDTSSGHPESESHELSGSFGSFNTILAGEVFGKYATDNAIHCSVDVDLAFPSVLVSPDVPGHWGVREVEQEMGRVNDGIGQ